MADEFIDRLKQKYKERAEPERDLVDNRKAVAHVKAEKQMKGRPPTELELLGQDERRNQTGFTYALIPLTAQQATPD